MYYILVSSPPLPPKLKSNKQEVRRTYQKLKLAVCSDLLLLKVNKQSMQGSFRNSKLTEVFFKQNIREPTSLFIYKISKGITFSNSKWKALMILIIQDNMIELSLYQKELKE